MAVINICNVEELGTPLGQYHHMTRVKAGEFLFIAGMLSSDSNGNVIGDGDFAAQCRQVFANLHVALRSAGADWPNVVQFTTYLVHSQSIPSFMEVLASRIPKDVPG